MGTGALGSGAFSNKAKNADLEEGLPGRHWTALSGGGLWERGHHGHGAGVPWRSYPTPQGASARRGRPWHPQELGCRKEGWEDKGATDKQPHLPRRSGPKFWTRWNQRGHLEQQTAGLVLGRWPPPLQPTGSEPTTRVVLQHLSPASSRHRQGRRG